MNNYKLFKRDFWIFVEQTNWELENYLEVHQAISNAPLIDCSADVITSSKSFKWHCTNNSLPNSVFFCLQELDQLLSPSIPKANKLCIIWNYHNKLVWMAIGMKFSLLFWLWLVFKKWFSCTFFRSWNRNSTLYLLNCHRQDYICQSEYISMSQIRDQRPWKKSSKDTMLEHTIPVLEKATAVSKKANKCPQAIWMLKKATCMPVQGKILKANTRTSYFFKKLFYFISVRTL